MVFETSPPGRPAFICRFLRCAATDPIQRPEETLRADTPSAFAPARPIGGAHDNCLRSFSGDQGTDPNALVSITDNLAATTQPAGEQFSTVMAPTWVQVIRGVSFTPQTQQLPNGGVTPEVPLPLLLPIAGLGVAGGAYVVQRRRGRASAAATA